MFKHYIRLNEKQHIIKAFSTAFVNPISTDILVNEDAGRQYNPAIHRFDGLLKYKYLNNKWVENNDDDLQEELLALIEPDYQAEFNDKMKDCTTVQDIVNVFTDDTKKYKVKIEKK